VKKIILMMIFFGLGFGTHMYLVKDKVPPMDASLIIKKAIEPTQTEDGKFIVYVEFDGEKFRPSSVNVPLGNYFAITNKSNSKLMRLSSDNPALSTSRGFGEGERLMNVMGEKGVFRVVANNDPKNSLVVAVE